MIRCRSHQQIPLAEFEWPFQVALDEYNRWVKMSECIPWDELAEGYYQGFSSSSGRPLKEARLAIGAVICNYSLFQLKGIAPGSEKATLRQVARLGTVSGLFNRRPFGPAVAILLLLTAYRSYIPGVFIM